MIPRLTQRLFQALMVMLVMSVAVHALMGLMPGDPIDLMIAGNPHLTPDDAARLKALYGVGQPWPLRWARWLIQVIQGNLGYSRLFARPVTEIMLPAIGHTLQLAGTALVMALMLGLPLGLLAGARPGSAADRLARLFSYASLSMPTFWLGLMLIAVFSVGLGWLPASGLSAALPGEAIPLFDRLLHLILPAVTLGLGGAGQYLRHMRAAMMAERGQPYLRTALAKGCTPRRVILAHQMRNALLPVVTIAALEAGSLLSGALITETVFAWPGLGRLSYEAVMGNDYNLALSALLLATAVTLVASALADLAYGIIDPRTGR